MRLSAWVMLTGVLLAGAWASAEVRLPALFSDHAVLQRDVPITVWGWASAGEEVSVSIGGQGGQTRTGADGKWSVRLGALPAGGPHVMTVRGTNTVTLSDVLVGEVWLTSGQSNMEFHLAGALDGAAEIAGADFPRVRLFEVAHAPTTMPAADVKATWKPSSPASAKEFSAVPYLFARDLHRALGVPVGVVNTSFSGTPIEAWIPRGVLESDPDYAGIFAREREYAAGYAGQMEKFRERQAKTATTNPTAAVRLRSPPAPERYHRNPDVLYNGMVAPLQPYAVRGMLWYQGEANAVRAWQYRKLLADMICAWRKGFGQGEFPVLVVQLANFQRAGPDSAGTAWAELREAQLFVSKTVPNTALAVTIDIGDPADIHPRNKQEVARRLLLLARAKVYGHDVDAEFPTYAGHAVEEGRVRVRFAAGTKGLKLLKGDRATGFTVAGADRKLHPAEAKLEGATVVVWSSTVPQPVAVRYGWASAPDCSLASETSGLPATPFRTDDWPALTVDEK